MIITGGFNVYPREIEDVLTGHESISQAAVIGVPDERWGEAVKAFVVRRAGSEVTERALTGFVKERLGSLHAPKSVEFLDEIPLSPLGKPDRKALRARHWGHRTRLVN
jgi:fatty-acyl-CoA synthase